MIALLLALELSTAASDTLLPFRWIRSPSLRRCPLNCPASTAGWPSADFRITATIRAGGRLRIRAGGSVLAEGSLAGTGRCTDFDRRRDFPRGGIDDRASRLASGSGMQNVRISGSPPACGRLPRSKRKIQGNRDRLGPRSGPDNFAWWAWTTARSDSPWPTARWKALSTRRWTWAGMWGRWACAPVERACVPRTAGCIRPSTSRSASAGDGAIEGGRSPVSLLRSRKESS